MSATALPASVAAAEPKAPSWRVAALGFTLSVTTTTLLALGLASL